MRTLILLSLLIFSCSDEVLEAPGSSSKKGKKKNVSSSDDSSGSGSADEKAVIQSLVEKWEECGTKKKAWVPTLEGGSGSGSGDEAGACGKTLVDWCCNIEAIKARFPAAPESLDERFNPFLTTGYSIYGCSRGSGDGEIAAHLIKRADHKTLYTDVSVSGLVDQAPGSGSAEACKIDLKAILEGKVSSAPVDVKPSPFMADINPIIKASCDGGGCHGPTASLPKYVDNEANVKAQALSITERVSNDTMPLGKKMTPADKQKLLDFLKAP